MDYRVISIGTLPAHPMWTHQDEPRTGHATTTLIQSHNATIIVDPGLPAPALKARLAERTDVQPADVTHVFCTTFHPDTRRALTLFPNATRLIAEAEREALGVAMLAQLQRAVETHAEDLADHLRAEITTLQSFKAAPDKLATGVDLFPLPGVTPGAAGLLLTLPRLTLVIAGDAVPTKEHFERQQAHTNASDVAQAKQSLAEVVEIADLIIPGRDNLIINQARAIL